MAKMQIRTSPATLPVCCLISLAGQKRNLFMAGSVPGAKGKWSQPIVVRTAKDGERCFINVHQLCASGNTPYIQSAALNGPGISDKETKAGETLIFEMGPKQNDKWRNGRLV